MQSDPAIAGRLLKVANAAAWGRPRPLVALRQAILALGALRVRDLVVGFSLLRHHQAGQCRTFDYAGFWSRSLATAIACQELAPRAQVPDEEIFTLGLLARVGELGLATLFPDAYGALLAGRPAPRALLVLENERFGFDHRALTASMLADWGLPELLLRAAYHHEFPDDSGLPEGSQFRDAGRDRSGQRLRSARRSTAMFVPRTRPPPPQARSGSRGTSAPACDPYRDGRCG